jgi:hypothetical protein
MELHTVEPVTAPRAMAGALSPEVITVSGLLSMPAVWTAVVDHALPFDVLAERFLIVLLSVGLVAELIRRLGEGGALTPVGKDTASASERRDESPYGQHAAAPSIGSPLERSPLDAGFDTGLGDSLPADTLALDTARDTGFDMSFDAGFDTGLGAGFDTALDDLGDLGDLGADSLDLDTSQHGPA